MKKYVNGEFIDLTEDEIKQIQDLENFSGGVSLGDMELIAEVEIEEEITKLEISADKDGKPFSLKEVLLLYSFPKYTGETGIPGNIFGLLNGIWSGNDNSRPLLYNKAINVPSATTSVHGYWLIEICETNKMRYERSSYGGGALVGERLGFGKENARDGYAINDKIGTIQSIGFANGLAYAGCKFILYGVRA